MNRNLKKKEQQYFWQLLSEIISFWISQKFITTKNHINWGNKNHIFQYKLSLISFQEII